MAKKSSGGGAVKKHGPKRHLFNGYTKCMRMMACRLGVVNKFADKEAFALSLASKRILDKGKVEACWREMIQLPTIAERKKYLKELR